MGYRSDGRWVIKGPVDEVRAAMAAFNLTTPPPADSDIYGLGCDTYIKTFQIEGVGYVTLQYEGWKWYESYSDIKWFEALWDHFEEAGETSDICGRRVRIGEDDDDVEKRSFGDEHVAVDVRRSVSCDEPTYGDPL